MPLPLSSTPSVGVEEQLVSFQTPRQVTIPPPLINDTATLLSASGTLPYLILTAAPLKSLCVFPVSQKLGSKDGIHNTKTAQSAGSLILCDDRGEWRGKELQGRGEASTKAQR